ncbi:hypothetical protein C440_01818 [Haloferax mucosum ATCC BAA-1512]|uniref:Uncharacterized protein n=1 Tax=Haloferax mucosum ATCC BAA-1512 TaxID=662479 RepID=M0IMH6_9EURY|nr:hypothetical protein [Haloferax mucosum]ELZ97945.1 hypothetical protein C440_01818 [Haloferax mucosum ATCC BAA-1512]
MISDCDRTQPDAETVDETVTNGGVDAWFARETPGIVAGLEASHFIGPVTATTARDLIAGGNAEAALSLVLREVDDSWRE